MQPDVIMLIGNHVNHMNRLMWLTIHLALQYSAMRISGRVSKAVSPLNLNEVVIHCLRKSERKRKFLSIFIYLTFYYIAVIIAFSNRIGNNTSVPDTSVNNTIKM